MKIVCPHQIFQKEEIIGELQTQVKALQSGEVHSFSASESKFYASTVIHPSIFPPKNPDIQARCRSF